MTDIHKLSSPGALPAPQETLTRTNWAELNHAYGPAEDVPKVLVALLDPNQAVRTKALGDIHHVVHHQNTLYEATAPTALYVAAILSDPRTTCSVDKDRWSFPGNMRAELLGWIDSVANDVTDAAYIIDSEHGFPLDDYPSAVAVRDIRPLLFSAAFAYTDDSDRHVREAAIAACIPLLDDPRVRHHQAALVPLIRQILGTSELWQYRERAIDALDAWGEDSTGLEGQCDPFWFCSTDLVPDHRTRYPGADAGCSEEPPF
ncbi:hypothetical protein [Streptomyces sp. NPDC001536]|uniref:hypothetical protein n=1 Tax=Streptomyces sp. NPDC001536 TaxID=3364583 RepID=UPI0036CA8FAD